MRRLNDYKKSIGPKLRNFRIKPTAAQLIEVISVGGDKIIRYVEIISLVARALVLAGCCVSRGCCPARSLIIDVVTIKSKTARYLIRYKKCIYIYILKYMILGSMAYICGGFLKSKS